MGMDKLAQGQSGCGRSGSSPNSALNNLTCVSFFFFFLRNMSKTPISSCLFREISNTINTINDS